MKFRQSHQKLHNQTFDDHWSRINQFKIRIADILLKLVFEIKEYLHHPW